MEEQMMKLQPVLEKLRNLDPKTFGLLNNMMDQAQVSAFFAFGASLCMRSCVLLVP